MMSVKKMWKHAISTLILVAMGACGGSGGDSSTPAPAPALNLFAGALNNSGNADGVASVALFAAISSIAADSVGNLYVVDNNAIRKITPSGSVTTLAGITGTSIAVDSTNNLYVLSSNSSGGTISKIAPDSTIRTFANISYATDLKVPPNIPPATGINPSSVDQGIFFRGMLNGFAIDSSGAAYVGGTIIESRPPYAVFANFCYSSRLLKIGLDGKTSFFTGELTSSCHVNNEDRSSFYINGLASDGSDNIYAAINPPAVLKTSPDGKLTTAFASASLFLGSSSAVAIDPNGNLYVADVSNNLIYKITPTGLATTIAGKPGSTGLQLGPLPASLSGVTGLAVSDNKLYITTANAVLWMPLP